MKVVSAAHLLDQLEGATISSWSCDDEEGMHFFLKDGRTVVVVGDFAVSVLQADKKRLH